jgi:hypothetical protein
MDCGVVDKATAPQEPLKLYAAGVAAGVVLTAEEPQARRAARGSRRR